MISQAIVTNGQLLEVGENEALIRVDAESMVSAIARMSSEYPVIDMRVEPVPLDEVIAELFQEQK